VIAAGARATVLLRQARIDAGFTQRELARRTGVAQPTIARIEAGVADARVETLDRLLSACGRSLVSRRRLGIGVDRTQIRELLRLTPRERLELLRDDVRGLRRLEQAVSR
jgi:transcriptional regulator with XRE-family HTH domain